MIANCFAILLFPIKFVERMVSDFFSHCDLERYISTLKHLTKLALPLSRNSLLTFRKKGYDFKSSFLLSVLSEKRCRMGGP